MADKKHDVKYLDYKLRTIFNFLDKAKNGRLQRMDMLSRADSLSKMSNASPEETKQMRIQWTKWCEALFFPKEDDTGITMEEFLKMYHDDFKPDTLGKYRKLTEDTYSMLFDRLDRNRDGMITREELAVYYRAIGAPSDQFIERVFRRLDDDSDGHITREEFVKAGREYWTNDDPDSGYEIMYDILK